MNRLIAAVAWRLRARIRRLPQSKREAFALRCASALQVDPLAIAYHQMGILEYDGEVSPGEQVLLSDYLPAYFRLSDCSNVVFDVGANVGAYSAMMVERFPKVSVHAFEPSEEAFCLLKDRVIPLGVTVCNAALGARRETGSLYSYADDGKSEHATLYPKVMSDLHKADRVHETVIQTETVDSYCSQNDIHQIAFMKIDVEGHEFAVLQGASEMLKRQGIGVLQFEFNEMNIISRVFLKDFYELLYGYRIFRLGSRGLIPLPTYSSRDEIFQFQNLLAVRSDLAGLFPA